MSHYLIFSLLAFIYKKQKQKGLNWLMLLLIKRVFCDEDDNQFQNYYIKYAAN